MEYDLVFFAAVVPAVLIAGISKGGFGSGAALATTPILALALDPGTAIGLMLPLLMVMDAAGLRPYWRKWDWPNVRVLALGAVPGTAAGALIYGLANPATLRLLIGGLALGFVAFQGVQKMRPPGLRRHRRNPLAGGFWGFVAGITSFISHAGGPVVAIHLLGQGMGKTTYQATTVLVFWIVNWLKFLPYLAMGIFTAETAKADLVLAPLAVAGMLLGVVAHRLVPERAYFTLVYALMIFAGLKLFLDGLGGMDPA